jgi:predicted site-specific integrase-resolvase
MHNVQQISEILGVARHTVGKWIRLGYFKPVSVEGRATMLDLNQVLVACMDHDLKIHAGAFDHLSTEK